MTSLLEPLVFRTGLASRNRIALAPMTNKQSHDDGTISNDEHDWLVSRAAGGFGVVMTCAAHVAKDGQGWPGELGVFDDSHLPGLETLTHALRGHGAMSMIQLFHGGMRADTSVNGAIPWSASEGDGFRAATEEDYERIVRQFAEAAERARKAGFDGIELHGAHGYLLTQHLSTTQNRRTDRWGGSLENRARLVRDLMRAVRAKVGNAFTVGVRLSPEDFGNAVGLDLDESVQTARWLADDGADFIHVSLWRSHETTKKRPDQHALPIFRAALPSDVKILVAGAIWTRDEAERLLALGADGVALGRSAIVNPDWPMRIAETAWDPKRPPVTIEELRARGLGPRFAEYMRGWKGFVA
ncbi:putative NADH-dependent flavin oxidoreductase yqiG [Labilithrix luteola]|uniref:Putative NADH-dependent flavin oxidoreductase yqiG n=1 Tax=Labilithrix luteola TaxID=1391654 RepID=A0A0K1PWY7_9BACT|nr:NADH:flavin oxidoreductase [Labilithrix luteola]AKU98045.1 putative NADH-dependent flavin oxidoreductase yqiG [Labilithrix luteola]